MISSYRLWQRCLPRPVTDRYGIFYRVMESPSQPTGPKAAASRSRPAVEGARPRDQSQSKNVRQNERRPFVPLLLISLTLVLAMGSQLFQALQDRRALKDRYEQQTNAVAEAKKVRGQLDTIARQTYQLSVNGNENAAGIVERMKKAGFSFSSGNQ